MLVGSLSEHLLAGAWVIHAIPNPWGNGDELRFLGNTPGTAMDNLHRLPGVECATTIHGSLTGYVAL